MHSPLLESGRRCRGLGTEPTPRAGGVYPESEQLLRGTARPVSQTRTHDLELREGGESGSMEQV